MTWPRGSRRPIRSSRPWRLAEAEAERSVFVGDTVWDMRAGARAGVRCVAVLCGGIPRFELEAAGAEAVFRDPAHLLAALEQSPLGREE